MRQGEPALPLLPEGPAAEALTPDPGWTRPARYAAWERMALALLADERDLVFVRVAARIAATVFPAALALFLLPAWAVALLALPYLWLVFAHFGGPYSLMLHATEHRRLFARRFGWMNAILPAVYGPLFGHTPASFFAHHVVMHHAEGNLEPDTSSTLAYRRDDPLHFAHYALRFIAAGWLHLAAWLWRRGHRRQLARFIAGEAAWFCAVALLWALNPAATLVVLVLPLLLMRLALMAGNWAQHAFVDVADAANPFRSATCLVDSAHNRRCYNDGYHIVHHIRPSMHWSEMARTFDANRAAFARHDAVVFRGVANNQVVWWALMRGDWDFLARHLEDFGAEGGPVRSHAQKVAFLQQRVRASRGARPALFLPAPLPARP